MVDEYESQSPFKESRGEGNLDQCYPELIFFH
jgi:hypothetical protein